MLGRPHEQALAADIVTRQNVPDTTDQIVALLQNPYPLVRYFAHHDLEWRFNTQIPIDMNLPGPDLVAAAKTWLASHPSP